jgi:hypothetical protein
MSKLFADIEAFGKKADADVVAAAKFTVTNVLPELVKIQANSSTIEAIASLAGPSASQAAIASMALLAWAVKTIQAANAAEIAGGINVTLDASLIANVKSVAALFPAPKAPETPAPAAPATKA